MRIDPERFISIPKENNMSIPESSISYQKGEIIKGTVLDILHKELLLQLQSGETIKAHLSHLLTALEIDIGESLYFQVDSISNSQIILTVLEKEQSNTKLDFILQALERANITPSEKNVDIVEHLLNHQLPIDKEHIQKALFYMHIAEPPQIETMAFFLKNKIPITKENIIYFQEYIVEKSSIEDQVQQLVQQLEASLPTVLLEELLLEWIQYEQQKKEEVFLILKSYVEEYGMEEEDLPFQDIESSIVDQESIRSFVTLIEGKELAPNSFKLPYNKQVEALLKQIEDPHQKMKKFMEFLRPSKLPTKLRDIFPLPLRPEEILNPRTLPSYYQELYQKISFLERELSHLLSEAKGDLQFTIERLNAEVQHIRQGLEFLNEFNRSQSYLPIPLQISQEMRTGELYVMKNKKKNKKTNDSIVSALLS